MFFFTDNVILVNESKNCSNLKLERQIHCLEVKVYKLSGVKTEYLKYIYFFCNKASRNVLVLNKAILKVKALCK